MKILKLGLLIILCVSMSNAGAALESDCRINPKPGNSNDYDMEHQITFLAADAAQAFGYLMISNFEFISGPPQIINENQIFGSALFFIHETTFDGEADSEGTLSVMGNSVFSRQNGTNTQTDNCNAFETLGNPLIIEPPPLPPAKPTFRTDLISCDGWFANLVTTWWPNPDSGGAPTSFEIEYTNVWPHYPPIWTDYHIGGAMCVPYTADATVTTFRARAINASGISPWKYDSVPNNCNSGVIGF